MRERLSIDVAAGVGGGSGQTLLEDVRRGLHASPRSIPPKHFYDARGSELFDRICDLPEYYLARREDQILRASAARIVTEAAADALVEFGSGAARKTRLLLDALAARVAAPVYVPFDVSEEMLRRSAEALLADYPTLRVHGVVGDYEREVHRLPRVEGRRLAAFLGSTIGNFDEGDALRFLRAVAATLRAGERLLVGFDLVKDAATLNKAYNDAAGVTAEFNRNVLRVINRELGADFEVDAFAHVAFFDEQSSRIEMHLRATRAMRVRVDALGETFAIAAGERIHTENSRKFTRAGVASMLKASGFHETQWLTSADGWVAVALAERDAAG